MSRLIDQKDTMIVWNHDSESPFKIKEFYVYSWTDEDKRLREEFGKQPALIYKNCNMSYGNCCGGWNELSKDQLICNCFRFIMRETHKDLQRLLLELGKINELSAIREMVYSEYRYCDEMYFNEFLGENYGVKS